MLDYEHKARAEGFEWIIGVDEAGRGPLAGPVVAAAVAITDFHFHSTIKDSKQISASQREKAFVEIGDKAYIGVGIVSEAAIDHLNILKATFHAMNAAINDLVRQLPDQELFPHPSARKVICLIDGNRFESSLPYHHQTIIKGDELVLSIACASIVAKVTRDRILMAYDRVFPQYGFKDHKGYPTREHKKILRDIGPSIIHRKTFQY